MRMKTKLPEGLSGIAEIMEMDKEEIRVWEFYKEVRSLFKDYNFNVLNKEKLTSKQHDTFKNNKIDIIELILKDGRLYQMQYPTLENGAIKMSFKLHSYY